ncbi:MAG: DUF1573 domain-containing protein [Muribaculaceae bacterium]|nr:DUF1573 domain-containing protein [Muribaculaceae bacterium]
MMRNVFLIGALTLALAAAAEGPENVWLEPEHDFGAFHEDMGVVTCEIRAVNTGDAPLQIVEARANCGCTTPKYSRGFVFPGDTAVVTIGYNPNGRPGTFEKKVVVTTNAVTSPRTTLTIRGTVIGSPKTLAGRYPIGEGKLRLQSSNIFYNEAVKPTCIMKYIEGYNASDDSIRPTVLGLPKYMTSIVKPEKVGPGENFIVSTTFDSGACEIRDVVQNTFHVAIPGDTLAVTTTAVVKDDYSNLSDEDMRKAPRVTLTPEKIDFAGVSLGTEPAVCSQEVVLRNDGKSPLKIYRLYSADEAISVTMGSTDDIKPGKSAKAKIAVDKTKIANRPYLDARVILITNDPQTPRRIIRVVSEITP